MFSIVSTVAARAGVFVSAPQKSPATLGAESRMTLLRITASTAPAHRTAMATRLMRSPRLRNEEKNPVPDWSPIAYTKRTSPITYI